MTPSVIRSFSMSLGLLLAGSAAAQPGPTPKGCEAPASLKSSAEAATLKVDGKTVKITVGDVDNSLADEICSARKAFQRQLYDLRTQTVEELVDKRLMEAEAKKRGLDGVPALVSAEMQAVPAPTDEAVKGFFEEYKDRMQGAAFDDVKAEIKEFLHEQAQEGRLGEMVKELRAAAGVKVMLEPWRVSRKGLEEGPIRGPKGAPITIVEFADYECPFCAQGTAAVEEVRKKFPGKVRVIFRDYPLGFHPQAIPAAVAARCAGKQGKFWEAHDALFALNAELPDGAIEKALGGIKGLDAKKLEACRADAAMQAEVAADAAAGEAAGVDGTPAFFINGIPLTGAQPAEAFAEIIERELSRSEK